MRWRRRAVVVAAALGLSGCGGDGIDAPPAGAVTIAYSGNVDGEIEPCG